MAKTISIENLFVYLAVFSDLLPLTLAFLFYHKTKSEKGLSVLNVYLLFDLFANIILLYFIPENRNHKYVYPIFTLIETVLFAGFYFLTFKRSRFKNAAFILSVFVTVSFIIYYIIRYLILPKPPRIDSVPIGIETVLMIVFLLMYLYEQINDTTTLFVYYKHSFWVAIGIIIFLAGSLFIFAFASQLPLKELQKYWVFTNIFCIVRNCFFTIAIYILARQIGKADDEFETLLSFENLN